MRRLNISEVRSDFAETINQVSYGKERLIVERRGKDLAAIIPVEDLKLLERLIEEEEDRLDLEEVEKALAESNERIPYEKVRKELGLTKRGVQSRSNTRRTA